MTSDGSIIVASVQNTTSTNTDSVFTSLDYGNNWTLNRSGIDVRAILIYDRDKRIFAAPDDGVIVKSEQPPTFGSWAGLFVMTRSYDNVSLGSSRPWRAISCSTDGLKLCAGDAQSGFFVSNDGGASWKAPDGNNFVPRQFSDLSCSSDGSIVAASASSSTTSAAGGVFVSNNGGWATDRGIVLSPWSARESWSLKLRDDDVRIIRGPNIVRRFESTAVSSNGTNMVAVSNIGSVFTSNDTGNTWTFRYNNFQKWEKVAISHDGTKMVAVASQRFASGAVTSANSEYIYTSHDGGINWVQRGPQKQWRSIAMSADGSIMVAVAGPGTSINNTFAYDGIYRSTDSGVTWTRVF
jgi:hypothetical protein